MTVYNIKEKHGNIPSLTYLKQFNKMELTAIYVVMMEISMKGFQSVQAQFVRSRND